MKQRPRIYYTESQKAMMWDRWKQGHSLQMIAQLFDRNHTDNHGRITDAISISERPASAADRAGWAIRFLPLVEKMARKHKRPVGGSLRRDRTRFSSGNERLSRGTASASHGSLGRREWDAIIGGASGATHFSVNSASTNGTTLWSR